MEIKPVGFREVAKKSSSLNGQAIKEKIPFIRYGLLSMVLIPKLTEVDEGNVCLSLLDGS